MQQRAGRLRVVLQCCTLVNVWGDKRDDTLISPYKLLQAPELPCQEQRQE